MGLFGPSQSELIEMFSTRDNGQTEKEFNYLVRSAKQNQEKRYSINTSAINYFSNLVKDLEMDRIRLGTQMQKECGPQKDWAIAGGIASGLLGGAGGTAVALATIQDNINSTKRHHENGREIVEKATKVIEEIDKNMDAVNKIAAEKNNTDHFAYTEALPTLIKYFKCENVSIIKNETVTLYTPKMFGGLETHYLDKLKAYNSIGYLEAKISIKNNFHSLFPTETHKIDGAFKISLYNGETKIAYSYVSGDSWSINNLKNAGFKDSFEIKALFKLIDKQIKIDPQKTYTAKFSEPNLWLVRPL